MLVSGKEMMVWEICILISAFKYECFIDRLEEKDENKHCRFQRTV